MRKQEALEKALEYENLQDNKTLDSLNRFNKRIIIKHQDDSYFKFEMAYPFYVDKFIVVISEHHDMMSFYLNDLKYYKVGEIL